MVASGVSVVSEPEIVSAPSRRRQKRRPGTRDPRGVVPRGVVAPSFRVETVTCSQPSLATFFCFMDFPSAIYNVQLIGYAHKLITWYCTLARRSDACRQALLAKFLGSTAEPL